MDAHEPFALVGNEVSFRPSIGVAEQPEQMECMVEDPTYCTGAGKKFHSARCKHKALEIVYDEVVRGFVR